MFKEAISEAMSCKVMLTSSIFSDRLLTEFFIVLFNWSMPSFKLLKPEVTLAIVSSNASILTIFSSEMFYHHIKKETLIYLVGGLNYYRWHCLRNLFDRARISICWYLENSFSAFHSFLQFPQVYLQHYPLFHSASLLKRCD